MVCILAGVGNVGSTDQVHLPNLALASSHSYFRLEYQAIG